MQGFGVLYYSNGNKAYEGEWQGDEFHGRGVVYNDHPIFTHSPFDYRDFNKLD